MYCLRPGGTIPPAVRLLFDHMQDKLVDTADFLHIRRMEGSDDAVDQKLLFLRDCAMIIQQQDRSFPHSLPVVRSYYNTFVLFSQGAIL
jgi:hypothetical protein